MRFKRGLVETVKLVGFGSGVATYLALVRKIPRSDPKLEAVSTITVPSRPPNVIGFPFWSVLFQYDSFPVTYESGLNNVPKFDAHIEVYSQDKIVRVNYDMPYVKGLPVTMMIQERIDGAKGDGYQERVVRKTYEDPYTLEFLAFYECAAGKKIPRISTEDARLDLNLFMMIMQAGNDTTK